MPLLVLHNNTGVAGSLPLRLEKHGELPITYTSSMISSKGVSANEIISVTFTKDSSRFLVAHRLIAAG